MLNIIDALPQGLLSLESDELYRVLKGPTLIHLPGRRQPPLFVSVLLHGNEDTGWCAVRDLLQEHDGRELPRALSIFIGNVEAARHRQRFLDHQPDYNRIWRLSEGETPTPEHKMMQQVVAEMRARKVFASVDIHNNTGLNPHYACVNVLDHAFFHLATLFSRTVVYFTNPGTVQSRAFAALCPAVTVECGQPGQPYGHDHACEFLNACLHLSEIPANPIAPGDIDLFHTVAVAKVPEDLSFGFEESDCDIRFVNDLDHLNFRELPADTTLGWVRSHNPVRLDVRDEQGRQVADKYFRITNGEIRTATAIMPSMLSNSVRAIRQDCLCYLMERYQSFFESAQKKTG